MDKDTENGKQIVFFINIMKRERFAEIEPVYAKDSEMPIRVVSRADVLMKNSLNARNVSAGCRSYGRVRWRIAGLAALETYVEVERMPLRVKAVRSEFFIDVCGAVARKEKFFLRMQNEMNGWRWREFFFILWSIQHASDGSNKPV